MSLLLSMMIYVIVGCGEWYLALRRTLACARGEKVLLVVLVFIENLLGLWVLSNFIRTNNWTLALCYSAGASAGALILAVNAKPKPAEASKSLASQRSHTNGELAVAQAERMLFDMAEPEKDLGHKTAEHPRLALNRFHHLALSGLKSTHRAVSIAGRDRWRHYFPSRHRDGQRIELSG